MTYTESAKELNRIAQKIYNCDNTINLRDKLVFEIMQCAEELKQFKIDSTISVSIPGEGVAIPMLDEFFTEFNQMKEELKLQSSFNNDKLVFISTRHMTELDYFIFYSMQINVNSLI